MSLGFRLPLHFVKDFVHHSRRNDGSVTMEVSQANWKSRLSQNGDPQAEAIAELREILVKRVSYSFQNDAIFDSAFVDDIVQDSCRRNGVEPD